MKNLSFKMFLILITIILFSSGSAFAQENISPEKRVLIQQVMELTNTVNLGVNTELKETNFQASLLAMIDQNLELNENQRKALKIMASESNDRVSMQIIQFNTDKNNSSELLKEVNFRLYNETFTEDELKELVDFYRTETGKKSAKFMMSFVSRISKQYGEIYNQKFKPFFLKIIDDETKLFRQKITEIKSQKQNIL